MNQDRILRIANLYKAYYDTLKSSEANIVYDDSTFDKLIFDLREITMHYELTEEDKALIKRILDAEYQIYQPDPDYLYKVSDHDPNWYIKIKESLNPVYWPRYKQYLSMKGWNQAGLQKLDYEILDPLLGFLGDPNVEGSFKRRGLVMGDVQSGKTSNYIGLICKAADAGYKVIILLTGMVESLRVQTQIRVEEGFIGWEKERGFIGVGRIPPTDVVMPRSATSRTTDFTGSAGEGTFLSFNKEPHPFIFITKKNVRRLRNIRETIANINIKRPRTTIDQSLLIIDDEADNASVNTNDPQKYDPTAINSEIRKLLNLFTKSNYVGYTATPFANIFIDPDSEEEMLKEDLFPEDFIYSLNPPNNYFGPIQMFIKPKYRTIQIIDDANESFPLTHDKDWDVRDVFSSLKEAINTFLIANSIRDLMEGTLSNTHRSMLINVSRFTQVQIKIEKIVRDYLIDVTNSVRYSYNLTPKEYMENKHVKSLYETYKKHYGDVVYSWEKIFKNLYNAIRKIEVHKLPYEDSRRKFGYDNYEEEGLRVIIVGGLVLSRGLTLEGLMVSYLYRSTSTFDVLMQMGRWFGYRNKPFEYGDLCKVWMLKSTKNYFEEITESIKQLKEDLTEMKLSGALPRDFGIRVRNTSNELGITDRNKMRNTQKYVKTNDVFGQVLETPFIDADLQVIKSNMSIVDSFFKHMTFRKEGNKLFAENIYFEKIINFLKDFHVHEANDYNYFLKDKVIDLIKKYELTEFDVVVINGSGPKININGFELAKVERSFDILESSVIRLNGKHRRLGGSSDTNVGLSEEDSKKLEHIKRPSQSTYLIENRKPLIMLYPLQLKKTKDEGIDFETKMEINNLVKSYDYEQVVPYGIGIGFPARPGMEKEETIYFVNRNTKWQNVMREMDNEEDQE